MNLPGLVLLAGLAATVAGMMLVVAGVIATGLFLPGVVLIGLGMLGFAAAAVLGAVGQKSSAIPADTVPMRPPRT